MSGRKCISILMRPSPGAGFTPAAPDIEGESPGAVAPGLGVLRGGKELPDVVEQAGVGGRIGAGGAADGGLIDGDDLVQKFFALNGASCLPGARLGPVQVGTQLFYR